MGKYNILIAEDTKEMQKLYEAGLSTEEFNITFVMDGDEAFSKYNENRYDIVLLDIEMPMMSGYAVLKKIREKEPLAKYSGDSDGKRTPVIIMATGKRKKDDIMGCMKLGINGYLVKPIDHKTLTRKITEIYGEVYPAPTD